MCVLEGVEKTFVRFYEQFFLFCMFRNSVVLFVASGQRCAIRGKDAGVHSSHAGFPIMCDKKGRCKVPGCKGTPKVMCKM